MRHERMHALKIGVSNLLWAREHDDRIAALLRARGIDRIDIAPTRYFAADRMPSPDEIRSVRARWLGHGIRITGMQSLLHQTHGLALFGDAASRAAMQAHLERSILIGRGLGATRLVFGSWQNRQRGAMPLTDAIESAAAFFRPLAELSANEGMVLGVEPIFAGYGSDFLNDHDEAARLVAALGSPGFGLVLDTCCAELAGEDLCALIERHHALIGHVQIAERALAPLASDNGWHETAGKALAGMPDSPLRPGRVACIEALTPAGIDPLATVQTCLDVTRRWYAAH